MKQDSIWNRWVLPLMVLSFITLGIYGFSKSFQKNPIRITYSFKMPDTIMIQQYYYELLIDSLKYYEGFLDTVGSCPGGKPTIGHGHQILPGDPPQVTPDQADSILRRDLDYCIARAREMTGLDGNKLLAVASFIFNCGEGTFSSSTLREKILSGKNPDDEWERWNKVNGEYNEHIVRFRKFQRNLYNSNL